MSTSCGQGYVPPKELLSGLHRALGSGGGSHLLPLLRLQQASADQGRLGDCGQRMLRRLGGLLLAPVLPALPDVLGQQGNKIVRNLI